MAANPSRELASVGSPGCVRGGRIPALWGLTSCDATVLKLILRVQSHRTGTFVDPPMGRPRSESGDNHGVTTLCDDGPYRPSPSLSRTGHPSGLETTDKHSSKPSLSITRSFMRFFHLPSAWIVALILGGASAFVPPNRGTCRFFLDTASVQEWAQLLPTGVFHGVTTNPQLMERAGEPNTVQNIHKLANIALNDFDCNEFMCQAWGSSVDELVRCGNALVESFPKERLIVKIPATDLGLRAASQLVRQDGVRVCLTAAYHRKQALAAVGVGADYIAPYLGRMTEAAGKDGEQECRDMQDIVNGLGGNTRILVASLREPDTLADLAMYGLDTFTFSPDVARRLFFDSWTEQAAAEFEESAERNRW